jgi:hypothetical protein
MDTTPNLNLPLIAHKQGLRATFHDEALKSLDALVMLSVIDRDLSSPPVSPAEGDRYIVKSPGSGDPAWISNHVVVFIDGGWRGLAPKVGWTCYLQDEGALIAWDGAAWVPALDLLGGMTELQNVSLLGVGTTADATNPFSAKLNNALWAAKTAAEGGDGNLRYKMSKESAAKTLSLLMQTNFSGRAEIGLTGDDDFHFKVSPDGTNWSEAIVIDRTSGKVSLPQTVSAFIETLLDDANAAAARATLGAVGLSGDETVGGKKTFSNQAFFTGGSRSGSMTIADDAAATISVPGTGTRYNLLLLWSTLTGATYIQGLVWCRTGSSPNAPVAVALHDATNFAATTGVLTGTTGTDGKITFSTHTDGLIYIENRLGGSRTFYYQLFTSAS